MDRTVRSKKSVADEGALPDERVFNWREITAHRLFMPSAVLLAMLCIAFFPLWKISWNVWFEPDSLYSHGPLIPLLAGYAVWIRWPRMKDTPVKPSIWALLLLAPVMYVSWIATRTEMKQTLSVLFIFASLASIWFAAGWRWMLALSPVVAFLLFGFPVWTELVDKYTGTMQHLSAEMAFRLLQLCGLSPIQSDVNTIFLDHFTLNVAAACSGAKLTLALLAFTAFFLLTRRATIVANVILVAIVVPFCLFVNGIRIAMVGLVGNQFGEQAGRSFHDYGGYIALVICFVLLNAITKALGYK